GDDAVTVTPGAGWRSADTTRPPTAPDCCPWANAVAPDSAAKATTDETGTRFIEDTLLLARTSGKTICRDRERKEHTACHGRHTPHRVHFIDVAAPATEGRPRARTAAVPIRDAAPQYRRGIASAAAADRWDEWLADRDERQERRAI